jgi:hypothetical protein
MPSPVALAVNEADWLSQTVTLVGLEVIAGAAFKLKVAAEEVAVMPSELVATAS